MMYNILLEIGDSIKKIPVSISEDATKTSKKIRSIIHKKGTKNQYSVIFFDNSSVEITATISASGNVSFSMWGYMFNAQVESERDSKFIEIIQSSEAAQSSLVNIVAPMPGMIKQVLVRQGDSVKKGDPLFVLEAMKMENMIKSSTNGLVNNVKVSENIAVEKGNSLCLIDPVR